MLRVRYCKVFVDEDPNKPETDQPCPDCKRRNVDSKLRYMYINIDLAVYKCPNCMYPHRDYKYKNYHDRTVYQLKILEATKCERDSTAAAADEFSSEFDPFMTQFDTPIQQTPVCTTPTFDSASFLDTEETKLEREKAAIEKLESELHDLLSEHLDLDEKDSKTEPAKPNIPSVELPSSLAPMEPPPKRRKLSKVYEFLERTTGNKINKNSNNHKNGEDPFKVPAMPAKVEVRHHRPSHRRMYKEYKLPKEVKSPLKTPQPSLFLQNVERQNVLLTDLNPVRIPVKIEVLHPIANGLKLEKITQIS